MGYVIAAILVLLIVAAGVTVFVLRATRTGRRASAGDRGYGGGVPGSDAAIVSPDDRTPLGDTDQHSGEQATEGRPVGGREGGRPGAGSVGGEAEGGAAAGPDSERLANRPR